MTKRWQRRSVVAMVVAALATLAVFAEGCNTVQSPKTQVNDAQITTQVKSKLASDVGADSLTNVDVNTTNGVVTLAGQVESANVKNRVETVTESIPGVVKVNNELQVAAAAASANH